MALFLLDILIAMGMAFVLGWYLRDIARRIRTIDLAHMAHITRHKRGELPEASGKVVEPIDDPVSAAKADFDAMQRRLNDRP